MNGVPTRYGGGIAILGAAHTAVLKTLDNLVVRWAVNAGAEEILPPPIHAVADLVKFDVYTNFPHLSLVAGPLRTDPPTKPHGGQFTSHQILPAGLGLPIATCFGGQIQPVEACDSTSSANNSEGFFQFNILRGRSLISQATMAK